MLPPVDPLTIACPQCHAAAWHPCAEATTGLRVGTHFSRSFIAGDLATRRDLDPDPDLRIAPLRDYVPDPVPAPKPPF